MTETHNKRLDLLIWFRLSRVYHNSLKQSTKHLKQWDLSPAQFDLLVQVGKAGRITQNDLADKLFVTKGNITQVLKKLIELELIEREQHWRTKYVKLMDKGQALFHEVTPLQEAVQAQHFSALTKEEKLQLLELLKKIQHVSVE